MNFLDEDVIRVINVKFFKRIIGEAHHRRGTKNKAGGWYDTL
jgi:hypothetical protein